jgi:hypothetical protein
MRTLLLLAAAQLPMQQLFTWAGQSWSPYCLRAGELAKYSTDRNAGYADICSYVHMLFFKLCF